MSDYIEPLEKMINEFKKNKFKNPSLIEIEKIMFKELISLKINHNIPLTDSELREIVINPKYIEDMLYDEIYEDEVKISTIILLKGRLYRIDWEVKDINNEEIEFMAQPYRVGFKRIGNKVEYRKV